MARRNTNDYKQQNREQRVPKAGHVFFYKTSLRKTFLTLLILLEKNGAWFLRQYQAVNREIENAETTNKAD